ncbi:uncharacterized protein ARMOST_01829 [Armillaria ostoyae]|uniref:Reverse transcriptase domain-containing protein n=1 Tax=Armillaria ostoyae TaxID=47428 RepID=A0A284QQ55_ARMOS|nr:uncharacterized protein ARMOST_01829 [Armillaria ostoyae]
MFHSAYLRALQFNDDAMSRVKITRMSADGSSKNFSVLDISKAPPESDLTRADFLECYNNLLEFVTSIGFGERTLQGLNEHLHAMLSDPQFSRWFEAYKGFDMDYRAKLFKDPFIPDPSSKSCKKPRQEAKAHGDERSCPEDTQANGSLHTTPINEMLSDALVPFVPYASGAVESDIEQIHAALPLPASMDAPFSLNGKTTHSYESLTRNMSVSDSTSPVAEQNPPPVMEPTSVPCAQTLTTERRSALVTEAHKVVTPYNAEEWERALKKYNLSQKYPNLVFDLTYGSPIGDPPPLHSTFIPPNMPSTLENPEIIEKYLADEIAAGRMGKGLTVDEAHVFFGGHFRTAPMGVVFDQAKPRVIHNLSARDSDGSSTNSWLDAKDWPTKWYTATMFEDAVVKAPPGTEAAALDWVKAYRCSPIIFEHKKYIACMWKGLIYPNHCAPFGLTSSGGIQGTVADAFNDILHANGIPGVFKWVDDYDILRQPTSQRLVLNGDVQYSYAFDLQKILEISRPLGITWHDVSEKGHDFQCRTTYLGFMWDLETKRVRLSEKKREKYLAKVIAFLQLRPKPVRYSEASSLHGTLQHVCFVYRAGKAYLPALSAFVGHFPNKWVAHHPSKTVWNDLEWWKACLSAPSLGRSLTARQHIDMDIWVDASDWGIGLVVGGYWAAWKLAPGWRSEGREIGWSESIAIELAAQYVTSATTYTDTIFDLRSDNTGVIDAHNMGRSRNPQRNASIRRLSLLLASRNLALAPSYVQSQNNLADPISCGVFGHQGSRLAINFALPDEIRQWLLHV